MDFIKNALAWFNGKKTLIGTIMLWVGAFGSQVVIGVWGISDPLVPIAIETLNWFGMAFGGVGVAHKIAKRKID